MKQVHINRLKRLREIFASAKKTKHGYELKLNGHTSLFEINVWARKRPDEVMNPEGFIGRLDSNLVLMPPACGTAACVAGTAGLVPEFRKAGLRTSVKGDYVGYRDKGGEEAFAAFFGLDFGQAYDICIPHKYPSFKYGAEPSAVTPHEVVRKLDAVAAAHGVKLT